MKKLVFILALFCTPVWAANWATCVLDKMPGTDNDPAAFAIYNICREKYPEEVVQGSGRGWFGYDSGTECFAAKAKNTRSRVAAFRIRWACQVLYDPPKPPTQAN